MAGLYEDANKDVVDGVRRVGELTSARNLIPNTSAAITGAPGKVADAYETGGAGAAFGMGVRQVASIPVGLAQDAYRAGSAAHGAVKDKVINPIAEGLSTAVRTAVTGNTEPVKLGPLQNPGRPLVSDVYPDESSRGAAKAVAAQPSIPMPKPPGLPLIADAQQPSASQRGGMMSIDMNLANESMARANAIRQGYLDSQAASDGGPRGGAISDSGAADSNATLARWGQERMIQRAIDSGNPKVMDGVARLADVGGSRYAVDARIASGERTAAADRAAQQGSEMARLGIDRERLGIDQQNSLISAIGAGIDNQVKQGQLAEQQRRGGLIDAVLNETDPAKRAAAERNIRLLSGNAPQENTKLEEARMGLVGELMKSYSQQPPLDPQTKQPIPFEVFARPALSLAGQPKASTAPTLDQYAAQVRARNPGQQLQDADIQARYRQMFGGSS